MWVKLDDEFFDNPKIARLSDKGQLLYIASLTYSAKHLTDGCLVERGVRMAKALVNATDKTVKELAEGGLWEPGEGCYIIHDWAKYNPPAAKVLAEREAARKRMFAVRSGERSSEPSLEQGPEVTPEVPPSPVSRTPLPRKPEPVTRSKAAAARERDDGSPNIFALYEGLCGTFDAAMAETLRAAEERYPAPWIDAAFKEARDLNKRFWRYIESILKRYELEGCDDTPKAQPRANGRGAKRAAEAPPVYGEIESWKRREAERNAEREAAEARVHAGDSAGKGG